MVVKEALVSSYLPGLSEGKGQHWNLQFIWHFQDWEWIYADIFIEVLYDNLPASFGQDQAVWLPSKKGVFEADQAVWLPSKKGVFEARSFYSAFRGPTCIFFSWKSIKMARVPWKEAFFVWNAALGRIKTVDNLRKRHILVVDWCYTCKFSGESIDHLLLHCSMGTNIGSSVFTLFGLAWVMPKSVIELLEHWQGWFQCHKGAKVLQALPLCLMP